MKFFSRLMLLAILFAMTGLQANEHASGDTELPSYEGRSTNSMNKDANLKVGGYSVPLSQYRNSKLGDPLWENQKLLSSELFDALGDYKISANIIEKEFDLDGKESHVVLKPSINPQRVVRVVQDGEVKDGIPSKNFKSRYMISDAMTIAASLKVDVELNSVLSFELFRAQSGITVQKISYVDSLEDYLNKTTEENLAQFVGTHEDLEKHLKEQEDAAKESAPQIAKEILKTERARADESPFSDEERLKLFLKGYFDPYKIVKTFIKIDAEKLKDDTLLKPGEILIKTFFIRSGPGLSLSKGVLELGFTHFNYEVFRIGFKKEAPGKLLIKTQIEDGNSDETKFLVGLPLIPFKPHRTTYTKSDYHVNEKLYRYNLAAQQAMDQIDSLFNHIGKPLQPTDYYEALLAKTKLIPGVIEQLFQRIRKSLGTADDLRSKTELGFWGSKKYKTKYVERNKSESMDGESTNDIIGEVQSFTNNRTRLIFYESDEDTSKKFRVLSRKDEDGIPRTDLGFEYIFDDSQTNIKEYKNYIQAVRMALYVNDNVLNTRAEKLNQILKDRLAAKSLDSDEQSVAAGVYFSQKFVDKVLTHKKEDLQVLIAQLVLSSNSTWKDLTHLHNKVRIANDDCAHLLNPVYKDSIFGVGKATCFKVRAVAGQIVNTFADTEGNSSQAEVAQVLTKLVDTKDVRPFIPMLMLQIGLLNHIDSNGMPVYNSLEDAFEKNEVEMSLTFAGDGIDGLQHEQVGEVQSLEVKEYAADFKMGTPLSTSPIIPQASLYVGANLPDIYLNFSSMLNAQSGNTLKGVLYKRSFGKESQAIALFKVPNLKASEKKDANSKSFPYFVEIPMVKETQNSEKLALQFWLEDSQGQKLSEPVVIRFKNPQY